MYGKISEANRMLGFLTLWRSSWNELGSMQIGMASVHCTVANVYCQKNCGKIDLLA